MEVSTITLFYFTCSDIKTAQNLSIFLLENSLIACSNIIGGLSIFSWNNKIEHSNEVTVVAKTANHCAQEVEQILQNKHPYQNPCILRFTVRANLSYLEFIEQAVKPL